MSNAFLLLLFQSLIHKAVEMVHSADNSPQMAEKLAESLFCAGVCLQAHSGKIDNIDEVVPSVLKSLPSIMEHSRALLMKEAEKVRNSKKEREVQLRSN